LDRKLKIMNRQVKILGGLILGGIAAYFIFRPKKKVNFSYPSKEMFGRGGFSSDPNAPQSQPYSVTIAGADGSLTKPSNLTPEDESWRGTSSGN
jgi:hypothetical protein